MDFELNEQQELVRDTARSFARAHLLPAAAELDAAGVFPTQQIAGLAKLGFLGIAVPEEHGGAGMTPFAYALALEEISAGCASCGVIMSVNNSLVCDPLLKYGSPEQRERWLADLATGKKLGCFALSEPGAGSDAAAQTCTATRDGDGWLLNGVKNFITNGREADLCIVFAMADRQEGVKGINAFLVPTDAGGYGTAKNEKKLGIKASSTTQIHLDNVRLGAGDLLGAPGRGFEIAMATLDGGRIGIAAQALGIARQAFEEARTYARERRAFGGPIANLQGIQFKLADMATELDAARLLLWRAALLKTRREPFGAAAAMAKLYASEMATRVTHQGIQIHGGYGFCKDYPAERHYRDARITEIYEGTSEIQRLVIARDVLRD